MPKATLFDDDRVVYCAYCGVVLIDNEDDFCADCEEEFEVDYFDDLDDDFLENLP